MSVQFYEKESADAVELGPADAWTKTTNADGSRTYTANTDGATCTVKFRPPREDQMHAAMKAGSKVTKHGNGQVEVEHVR